MASLVNRREWLLKGLRALIPCGFFYMIWMFIRGTGSSNNKVCFSTEPEEGDVVFNLGAYLVGLRPGVKALSSRCPHLGCRLTYNSETSRFQCPCHGSQFALDGHRLEGPAQKDMTALNLQRDNKCGAYIAQFPLI